MKGITLGCLSMFFAVAAGAFGTHVLESQLEPHLMNAWRVGVQFQTLHSLALILAGIYCRVFQRKIRLVKVLFAIGIFLFSGSLYLLAVTGFRGLGIVTPFGGLAFLGGWLAFAWNAWRAEP